MGIDGVCVWELIILDGRNSTYTIIFFLWISNIDVDWDGSPEALFPFFF